MFFQHVDVFFAVHVTRITSIVPHPPFSIDPQINSFLLNDLWGFEYIKRIFSPLLCRTRRKFELEASSHQKKRHLKNQNFCELLLTYTELPAAELLVGETYPGDTLDVQHALNNVGLF